MTPDMVSRPGQLPSFPIKVSGNIRVFCYGSGLSHAVRFTPLINAVTIFVSVMSASIFFSLPCNTCCKTGTVNLRDGTAYLLFHDRAARLLIIVQVISNYCDIEIV